MQYVDGLTLDDEFPQGTNGRVYDGNTLAEVWPRQRPMPKQWWMTHDAMPVEGNGR